MEPAQLSLWTLPRQGSTQTLLSPPANQEHRPEQSSPTVLCRGKTYMPQSCHCMEDPLLSGVTSSCHHYGFQLHCFLQSECNTMVMYTHIYTYLHVCVCSAAQSCLTLCHSMDCSQPGSSVHEILQARILEWVAMSSSSRSSQHRDQTCSSCCLLLYKWIL